MTNKTGGVALSVFLACLAPLRSEVMSGGAYILDRSFANASHQSLEAASQVVLDGCLGEISIPAARPQEPIKAPGVRIYTGFLGTPLKATPLETNRMILENGQLQVVMPAGGLPDDYEAMIELSPQSTPIRGDPSIVTEAIQKLVLRFGHFVASPRTIAEIRFLLDDGTLFTDRAKEPDRLTLAYDDRGDGGKAVAYRLDETVRAWVPITDATINAAGGAANSGVATIFHGGGIVAVFQHGPTNTAGAFAFPVPWRPHANNPALYGTLEDGITFTNLPSTGFIDIYNIAGERVRELAIPPGLGELRWDGTTGSGSDVASGVYIWSVESEGSRKLGKLMIVR